MSDKGLNERIDDIEILMTGNGSPEKGMIVRLDRLEQGVLDMREELRRILSTCRWIISGIGTLIITILTAAATMLFG